MWVKIGVDFDDVLVETIAQAIKYYNYRFNKSFVLEDVKSYYLHETWGGTKDEAHKIVEEFYETDFFKSVAPITDAMKVVKLLAKEHELFIITNRPEKLKQKTEDILEKFFEGCFKKLCFTNLFCRRDDVKKVTKKEWAISLELDIHVEDGLAYAEECAEVVKQVILYDRPWNRKWSEKQNIIRVSGWPEIYKVIQEK